MRSSCFGKLKEGKFIGSFPLFVAKKELLVNCNANKSFTCKQECFCQCGIDGNGEKVLVVEANDGIGMVVVMALKEVVIVIVAMKC